MNECILCNSHEYREVYSNDIVEIIRCSRCGLVRQQDYARALAKLNSSYSSVDSYYEQRGLTAGYDADSCQGRIARTKDIRQELGRNLENGCKVLDVGCGWGEFLDRLGKQYDLEVIGVEPDSQRASFAAEQFGIKVLATHYREDLFPDNYFDAITFIQVFEHLEHPRDVLKHAWGHLKPNGLLVIDVPSFNNPRIIAFRSSRIARLVKDDFIPSHCFFYTARTLSRMVREAGFVLLKVQTGRYSVKHADNRGRLLLRWIDTIADRLRIGGIVLYGQKIQ